MGGPDRRPPPSTRPPSDDDKESEPVVTANFQAELRASKDGYFIIENSSPHPSDDRILSLMT